ncbi:MAG: DUF4350 domain-containing protein [Spirochaetaceae bacterium]|nr:DUF4350 domain-containing protein [Spirochaetaceae bacterium]
MDKHAPALIVTASILVVIAILAFSFFEVTPWDEPLPPSPQALENEFLALERWLTRTGHPVRTETSPNAATIPRAGEGTVYVQASLFRWSEQNYERLKPWVEKGGRLLVSLDREWNNEYSEGMEQLFLDLGIESARFFGADQEATDNGAEDDAPDETSAADADSVANNEAAKDGGEEKVPPGPSFDYRIKFDPGELPSEHFAARDSRDIIRLVTVKMGEGSVTLFGAPVFMRNFRLRNAPNARLAWSLTGAEDRGGKGVLFIRGRKPSPGFWRTLAGGGNLLPFLLSLAVVLVIGFWMIVPVFGQLFDAPEKPGKPIGERFLAEARFLKHYGALDSYIEPYRETIRQGLAKHRGSDVEEIDEASCRALAELCGVDHNDVYRLFNPRRPGSLRSGEFVRDMETIHTILERL